MCVDGYFRLSVPASSTLSESTLTLCESTMSLGESSVPLSELSSPNSPPTSPDHIQCQGTTATSKAAHFYYTVSFSSVRPLAFFPGILSKNLLSLQIGPRAAGMSIVIRERIQTSIFYFLTFSFND